MANHRRLDEFAPEDPSGSEHTPPEITYRWDPNGETCGSCGESVTTVWQSEHGRRCVECKEW